MAMSPPADAAPMPVDPAIANPPTSPATGLRTTLTWVILAGLMLGASAAVRAVQDRRYLEQATFSQECPFPLEQIPRTLGRWKSVEDDQKLDSKTLLITGGKEYTIRLYTDDLTGVRLVVLLLFGPVEPVIPHVPGICYPSNGFKNQDQPLNRKVKYTYLDEKGQQSKEQTAVFEAAVYRKSRLLEGVYHSFRYDGVWSPNVTLGQGLGQQKLGVFKVQIQRMVAEGESHDSDKYPEPIEDFLKSLLPNIEHNLKLAEAKGTSKAVASAK